MNIMVILETFNIKQILDVQNIGDSLVRTIRIP